MNQKEHYERNYDNFKKQVNVFSLRFRYFSAMKHPTFTHLNFNSWSNLYWLSNVSKQTSKRDIFEGWVFPRDWVFGKLQLLKLKMSQLVLLSPPVESARVLKTALFPSLFYFRRWLHYNLRLQLQIASCIFVGSSYAVSRESCGSPMYKI